ncbi:zinc finger MYM-type protein 1-like [Vigna unguiculata]|uniref:zinc finger MYM-type protein 1-like n=1 Tax=Vigna unguiculata TaxID=3917 RepID=UPI001016ECF6|nr:zinc finger MYM-type protein 1-like [Vigna unguiculata]
MYLRHLKTRLRLKTSIDTVRFLSLQACAFRGHDESTESRNQGNFLEMIKLIASYNDEVAKVVLENASFNSKYTSPKIQKELLNILSSKVKNHIREEIGDSKFCIVVDEAHTATITLKNELCVVLSRHNLNVSNIRGQGYDGASNMRGEWNGLQALFLTDCPYAYYVHCFAHRLQLALVAASREVITIHQFFSKLTFIVNIVCSSSKRHDELQAAKLDEIAYLLEIDELEKGKGANQIGTLKRAGDTRWSSHFSSICRLINMYDATCLVLEKITVDGSTYSQRGDADNAYKSLTSFEFILILYLMREIMGITDVLCQALQQQSQDIVNVMRLVCSTKGLIQNLRENGWDKLLKNVTSFCEKHDIEVPNFGASYVARDIATSLSSDSIIEDFKSLKEHKGAL